MEKKLEWSLTNQVMHSTPNLYIAFLVNHKLMPLKARDKGKNKKKTFNLQKALSSFILL